MTSSQVMLLNTNRTKNQIPDALLQTRPTVGIDDRLDLDLTWPERVTSRPSSSLPHPNTPLNVVMSMTDLPQDQDIASMEVSVEQHDQAGQSMGPINPVPMSFPSFLRNPKLSDRYAYLQGSRARVIPEESEATSARRKRTREDKEGKRWVRRKENGMFRSIVVLSCLRMRTLDML